MSNFFVAVRTNEIHIEQNFLGGGLNIGWSRAKKVPFLHHVPPTPYGQLRAFPCTFSSSDLWIIVFTAKNHP